MPEKESTDRKDKVVEVLEEILKWIKVTSIPQVKQLLLDTLPSDKEKVAYYYSDGQDSRAVSTASGVPFTTVTRWWKRWIRSGIAEPVGAKRGDRAKRIFSLEDFGIEVPLTEGAPPENKTLPQGPSEVSNSNTSTTTNEKAKGSK